MPTVPSDRDPLVGIADMTSPTAPGALNELTDTATLVVAGDAKPGDLQRWASEVCVLLAIMQRLQASGDPLAEAGGTGIEELAYAAKDWIDVGVDPTTVGAWLDVGCYRPDRVRDLVDAGVTPDVFYGDDGNLLQYREELMYANGEAHPDLGHLYIDGEAHPDFGKLLAVAPLSVYVMDGEIAPDDVRRVAERMRQPCIG